MSHLTVGGWGSSFTCSLQEIMLSSLSLPVWRTDVENPHIHCWVPILYTRFALSFLVLFLTFSIFLSKSIQEKMSGEVGLLVAQQRLIFRQKVLKDEHRLSDYRILFTHLSLIILFFIDIFLPQDVLIFSIRIDIQ